MPANLPLMMSQADVETIEKLLEGVRGAIRKAMGDRGYHPTVIEREIGMAEARAAARATIGDPVPRHVGDAIRAARKAYSVSLGGLADALGITASALSSVELGRTKVETMDHGPRPLTATKASRKPRRKR